MQTLREEREEKRERERSRPLSCLEQKERNGGEKEREMEERKGGEGRERRALHAPKLFGMRPSISAIRADEDRGRERERGLSLSLSLSLSLPRGSTVEVVKKGKERGVEKEEVERSLRVPD